jgi:hypothetical protein
MSNDIIHILEGNRNDRLLGAVIREVLDIVSNATFKSKQSGGGAEKSTAVSRIYSTRSGLPKFRKECFSGLFESISSLSATETMVQLHVIETLNCLISVWLSLETGGPIGVVIAKYPTPGTEFLIGSDYDK